MDIVAFAVLANMARQESFAGFARVALMDGADRLAHMDSAANPVKSAVAVLMVSYDKIVASATAVLMEGFDERALCAYLVHMVSSRAGACLARLHALMAGERICAESVSVVSMGNSNTIATFARRAHMESSSSAATFARRAHMESSSRTAKSVVAVSMVA